LAPPPDRARTVKSPLSAAIRARIGPDVVIAASVSLAANRTSVSAVGAASLGAAGSNP
jgi:microcystin degradation protein MlrC